jgi:hypothetical protein
MCEDSGFSFSAMDPISANESGALRLFYIVAGAAGLVAVDRLNLDESPCCCCCCAMMMINR